MFNVFQYALNAPENEGEAHRARDYSYRGHEEEDIHLNKLIHDL